VPAEGAGLLQPALLLVDLQEDFLARPGLVPSSSALIARAAALADACRARGVPVVHVHTRVGPDGSDRMPHWKRQGTWACVEGTPGALAPEALRPRPGERAFAKRFFGAFGAGGLEAHLEELGARTLLLAGVYLHSCVRQSALEAYERGFEVWIVDDAVGSLDAVHGEATRAWLAERAARFVSSEALLAQLAGAAAGVAPAGEAFPASCIGGVWRAAAGDRPTRALREPADAKVSLGAVPLGGPEEIAAAAEASGRALRAGPELPEAERIAFLERFAARLEGDEATLESLLVREIGKPRAEARAEVCRAAAHVRAAVGLVRDGGLGPLALGPGVSVRWRRVGALGLVTPWNNPVAIPVGKLAPALAFGNAVLWKPACEAPRTAMRVLELLFEAGCPPDRVGLVFGDAATARALVAHPAVDAVSVTGSVATGRSAAALCALYGKPLQAELGGNNAAIVLADCEVEPEARGLALAAMSFAGQRCTATRRVLVERALLEPFTEALVAAVEALRVGDPADEDTEVGPLVSLPQRERVADAVAAAVAGGGRVLCGGRAPAGLGAGSYYLPTLVAGLDPRAPLVQEETFGPVAVVLPADDLDDAIRLANDVPQGLVASLSTRDAAARRRFADAALAGILKLVSGPLAVAPDAPFLGWKASGIGPPEHGVWDREFYARPQAVYGPGEP
jgi:acyl-CoA reductase-like NAD-dependent aldehyde dehydrogenase/nicotinamidase-related amidase